MGKHRSRLPNTPPTPAEQEALETWVVEGAGKHRAPEETSIEAGTITVNSLVSENSITVSAPTPSIARASHVWAVRNWIWVLGIFGLVWADVHQMLKLFLLQSWWALVPGSAVITGALIIGICHYSNRRLTP